MRNNKFQIFRDPFFEELNVLIKLVRRYNHIKAMLIFQKTQCFIFSQVDLNGECTYHIQRINGIKHKPNKF